MFKTIIVTGASLLALTAPSLAAGSWNVLKDASSGQCYAANRAAGPSESLLIGNLPTENAASKMINQIAACDGVLHDQNSSSG